MYSVKDNVAGVFGSLLYAQNDATALRMFHSSYTQIGAKDNTVNPFDYSLYYIGDFDNESGVFDALDTGALFVGSFEPFPAFIDYLKKQIEEENDYETE
jgi:hypothetical protein